MREKIRDRQRLEHILEAVDTLLFYRQKYSDDEIAGNPIMFFGFVKHLEIIGEAAYMLTSDFKNSYPEVVWHELEGMRHILVHGYYTIDKNIIISTLREDIDILRSAIIRILNEYSQ